MVVGGVQLRGSVELLLIAPTVLQLRVMTSSLLVLPYHGHSLWEFIHKLLQGLPEITDV